ncbi:MAG: hypothetical protein M5R41_12095 [Bacteroidia bacterium]|nr:hypothetical protein [Bacteroidia bacterium]
MGQIDERDFKTVDNRYNLPGIALVEIDSFELCEHIDSVGGLPKLYYLLCIQKIRFNDIEIAEAKVTESQKYTLCVVGIRAHPDIKIFRVPRMTVKRNRVPSDDEKADLTPDKALNEIFEVTRQQALLVSRSSILRTTHTYSKPGLSGYFQELYSVLISSRACRRSCPVRVRQ